MARFIAPPLTALLVLALSACVSAAPRAAPIVAAALEASAPVTLRPGVVYRQEVRGGERPMVAHIVAIERDVANLSWRVTGADRTGGMEHTAQLTSAYVAESGAVLAMNASYFLPFAGGSRGGDDYYPHIGDPVNVSGAAIAAGAVVSPVETDLDLRVNAIACFAGGAVLILDGQACPAGFPEGVAAGPRLLAGGERRSFTAYDNNYAVSAHPRTAIGVSADGGMIFVVVVDGRQPGYSVGASLEELTDLFVRLGAAEAINLDGGGSATLAAADEAGGARVLNRPIHTGVPGRERPVANHIGLFDDAGAE